MKYGRWCPNGCGKKVLLTVFSRDKDYKKYKCLLCKKRFNNKELEQIN